MRVKFSIIIPVYNDAADLELVLDAIEKQDVPKEAFEVLVVDNGSKDDSIAVASRYSNVNVIQETEHLGSPYSCRNRGIDVSTGEIIVLLDASCKPVTSWLSAAEECFEQSGADMVGGNVLFDFKGRVTAGKIYDAMTNIKMKESIENRNVAKTANLFVKKELFKHVGVFPEGIRSGADVRWTRKATSMGFKLVFCKNAAVYKTARGFRALIKKQWRVGKHQPLIFAEEGKYRLIVRNCLIRFIPIAPGGLKKKHAKSSVASYSVGLLKLWFVAHTIRFFMSMGNLWGAISFRAEIKQLNTLKRLRQQDYTSKHND